MHWVFAVVVACGLAAEPAAAPEWRKDLESARLAAAKSGKPLFIVFT
ncbi:MAG: hypothetical protein AAF581_23680 [Planctomycetota bacterium]